LDNFDVDKFISFIKSNSSNEGIEIYLKINENGSSQMYKSQKFKLERKALESLNEFKWYLI
jgi:hypothetical protein